MQLESILLSKVALLPGALYSEIFESALLRPWVVAVLDVVVNSLQGLVSFELLVTAIIAPPDGCEILTAVIANAPLLQPHVTKRLIELWSVAPKGNSGEWLRARCSKALYMLSDSAPHLAMQLREALLTDHAMPGLMLSLALAADDTANFFVGLLQSKDKVVWVCKFLKECRDNSSDTRLLENLFKRMKRVRDEATGDPNRMGNFLRIFCVLYRMAGFCIWTESLNGRTTTEEDRSSSMETMLDFLTQSVEVSAAGAGVIKLTLCTLVTCPPLTSGAYHNRIVEWLASLVTRIPEFSEGCEVKSGGGYSEMLLLMAVHFHTGNISAVAALARDTLLLNFHLDIPAESLRRMGDLLTKHVFTDDVLAIQSVAMAATPGLHAGIPGYLPVHCAYHAMRSRMYVKHKIQVKQWVLGQILACDSNRPVYPLLPALVQALADLSVDPFGTVLSGNTRPPRQEDQKYYQTPLAPIAERDLDSIFVGKHLVAQVLALLYILTFNACVDRRKLRLAEFSRSQSSAQLPARYSQNLLARVPIKQLLMKAEARQELFVDTFPILISLASAAYPELFDVMDLLRNEEFRTAETGPRPGLALAEKLYSLKPGLPLGIDAATDPVHAYSLLLLLRKLTDDDLALHSGWLLKVILPQLLDPQMERRICLVFAELWDRLATTMPSVLWLSTAIGLAPRGSDMIDISHARLLNDPLLVLKCDPRALRNPVLLQIVLKVFSAYSTMSTKSLSETSAMVGIRCSSGSVTANEEPDDGARLIQTLLMTQSSAIVHILLELCEPGDAGSAGSVQEVRSIACLFIHQLFIETPLLAKLVHFQGYNPSVLPYAVVGIPSMHICTDFLAELLVQPAISKQVFAVQVVASLATRYPVEKVLDVARTVLGRMEHLIGTDPAIMASFFIPAVPCLVDICKGFPLLTEAVIELLLRLRAIESAHCAAASTELGVGDGKTRLFNGVAEATFSKLTSEVILTNGVSPGLISST